MKQLAVCIIEDDTIKSGTFVELNDKEKIELKNAPSLISSITASEIGGENNSPTTIIVYADLVNGERLVETYTPRLGETYDKEHIVQYCKDKLVLKAFDMLQSIYGYAFNKDIKETK